VALDTGAIVSVEFIGGPDAALAILGAIAASMVTLTGIVLTIVLVVVQFAMGQFSPRIVRAILHDRPSQFAIGIFVAAFAHAMLAMREIASTEEGAPVPGLSILVAFGLVVVSIVALIFYINHIGHPCGQPRSSSPSATRRERSWTSCTRIVAPIRFTMTRTSSSRPNPAWSSGSTMTNWSRWRARRTSFDFMSRTSHGKGMCG